MFKIFRFLVVAQIASEQEILNTQLLLCISGLPSTSDVEQGSLREANERAGILQGISKVVSPDTVWG